MPSSTSSSDSRLPDFRFGPLWWAAMAVFLGLLILTEGAARRGGHRPSVGDGAGLWEVRRSEVYSGDGRRGLVVVGASRSQLGLVPGVLESGMPGFHVVHLAINGTTSFEVVRDLCEDEGFDGVILWDSFGTNLGGAGAEGDRSGLAYVNRFHSDFRFGGGIEKALNEKISAFVQGNLVVQSQAFHLESLLLRGVRERPLYISMDGDRYMTAHYRRDMTPAERAHHRRLRVERRRGRRSHEDPEELQQAMRTRLAPLQSMLRSRGGTIVMVRMPTDAEHWEMDEEDAPRSLVWDRIEGLTGIPTIHFMDHPGLRCYECPDTSHLDATDAPEFTRTMAEVLKKRLDALGVPR